MPIYEGRRRGTFRVTVWVRGKPVERILEGTRAEARDLEARLRIEHRVRRMNSRATVDRFSRFCVEEYSPHAQAHLGAKTWQTRGYILATLIEHFGRMTLPEVTTEQIDAFARKQRAAGLEPNYINTQLQVLGTVLRFAREDREQPVSEFRIRMLPTREGRVRCWSTEDVVRILAASRRMAPRFEPMLVFLLNTGCRKGESIAAEWSWVDERARLLRIPVTRYWRPKSGRPREVPIGDVLWSTLRKLPRTSRWVFPTMAGEAYRYFPDELRPILDELRLEGTVHWTRHTYASHFLQSQPDLFLLAAILGHSTTRVTELYAHLLPGHHERARNAVNLGGTMAKRRAS